MARNEHKRQQKLLKKKQRTNQLAKLRNSRLNTSNRQIILAAAERAPWIGCYLGGDSGMRTVFAIRQTRNGVVASVFLVDLFCLGIKDAFFIKDFDMESFRGRYAEAEMTTVSPEYALKLILDATAYARNIGFEPSSETGLCKLIFGNVDPTTCTEEFVFGRNGKPTYTNGPNDSPEKQRSILDTLQKLGQGNYEFILGDAGGPQIFSEYAYHGVEENFDEDDFEDDEEGLEDDGSVPTFDSGYTPPISIETKSDSPS